MQPATTCSCAPKHPLACGARFLGSHSQPVAVRKMLSITTALSHNLNLLRALAAFFVVSGHVTAQLFSSSPEDRFTAFFVALNSLGHHGVVVFFVLSGFLVGRKAIEAFVTRRSSAAGYIVDRITRIYVVLLPALAIGAMIDSALLYYSGISCCAYIEKHLTVSNFVGSLLGLQTVAFDVFGSNAPLWSLANETWYYILFPLALISWSWRSWQSRLGAAVAGVICASQLPVMLLKYGLVWLVGIFASVPTKKRLTPPLFGWLLLLAFLLTAPSRVLQVPGVGFAHVMGTALAIGLLVNSYGHSTDIPGRKTAAVTKRLADSSYSLYLFHFPFLIFVTHVIRPAPLAEELSVSSLIGWLGVLILVYLYAYIMYLLTERYYHVLRELTYRALGLSRRRGRLQVEPCRLEVSPKPDPLLTRARFYFFRQVKMALAEKFKIVLTAMPPSTARFKTYLLSCKPSGNQDRTSAAKETLTTAPTPQIARKEMSPLKTAQPRSRLSR